jgi:hypothetical protein
MNGIIYVPSSDSDDHEYINEDEYEDDETYDSNEYEDEDEETYDTNNISEDDSSESTSYEKEDSTYSEEEGNNADSNRERHNREEDNPLQEETENEMERANAANAGGVYANISNSIDLMGDDQIGQYRSGNAYFRDIIARMNEIRTRTLNNDFHQILEMMTNLKEDDEFLEKYSNLRGIYEFVFHMFDIYEVPLDGTVPPQDDRLLRTTMKKAAGKKI